LGESHYSAIPDHVRNGALTASATIQRSHIDVFGRHWRATGRQMDDSSSTNQELLKEISLLHEKIKELEQANSAHRQIGQQLRESGRSWTDNLFNAPFYLLTNKSNACHKKGQLYG
jgi:urease accessory protein UreF